jgi:hypothetical protein
MFTRGREAPRPYRVGYCLSERVWSSHKGDRLAAQTMAYCGRRLATRPMLLISQGLIQDFFRAYEVRSDQGSYEHRQN